MPDGPVIIVLLLIDLLLHLIAQATLIVRLPILSGVWQAITVVVMDRQGAMPTSKMLQLMATIEVIPLAIMDTDIQVMETAMSTIPEIVIVIGIMAILVITEIRATHVEIPTTPITIATTATRILPAAITATIIPIVQVVMARLDQVVSEVVIEAPEVAEAEEVAVDKLFVF